MATFSNGEIVIGKANINGYIIETLCVKVERKARKKKEIVLYPILDANNNYILESIDVAGRAGLEKEYIEQEIKGYIANKDNYSYKKKMKSKVTEEEKYNSNDLFEKIILAATTLEELAEIYWKLEKRNLISRYKNKVLSRLKEVNVNNPFFYNDFNKYQEEWVNEENNYSFIFYMIEIDLLLQKYSDVNYDDLIDFNGLQIKKEDYLKELLYNFMEQWQDYQFLYALNEEDYQKFSTVYSKFEFVRYFSYPMAILYLSLVNLIKGNDTIVSKSIEEIVLMYDKKVENKMAEINIPSLSFEQSYRTALENNSSIDYAKAFFQAKTKEDFEKIVMLEEQIKNSFFNIEECSLLQVSFLKKHKTIRDWEIHIVALVTLLDNANLKNSLDFKRLHYLFYQYLSYFIDEIDLNNNKSSRVLLKIKELYDNNNYKYDELIKREYKYNMT